MRPDRPSASEDEAYALAALPDSDRRHTFRELARETGLAHTTVLHILKERLCMRKIASRWVPHDLTDPIHLPFFRTMLGRMQRKL
ncbi:hypothetical protein AVEN_91868-1 [Araneus ventricosus]|uniref:HTH iclR-type domain-containing protein n=1 Tax=Araneus ventricosus TaxID=182803 RepID=A0A4Y2G4X2_ARAVE|nr:hypothetical protein AVEN_91868-1 [Araneus ventricosus]